MRLNLLGLFPDRRRFDPRLRAEQAENERDEFASLAAEAMDILWSVRRGNGWADPRLALDMEKAEELLARLQTALTVRT